MEKSKSAISEQAFHERITEATSSRSYGGNSYAPQLEIAFLPQPVEQHAVHGAAQRRDEIFQSFHNLGLARFKQGYEDWDDRSFTGLKLECTSWRVRDDGLVLLETDASVPMEGHTAGLYFVSPTNLAKLIMSCFEVAAYGSGWYRITLKNLDMAKIEEPPATIVSQEVV